MQVGDEIIVHHNVFRRFRDVRGNEKNSKSYFTDDMFFVYQDQIFAYKRGDSDWKAIARYTFVQPIVETRMFATETERDMVGIVKYTDGAFEVGDLVGFSPGTEYEFNIEGNRVYRVPTHKITIKYEYQGDEKEYNPSWT